MIRAGQHYTSRSCQPTLLPGGGLLHVVQVQLADDSLHAVLIALREKTFEIFEGLDGAKLLRWRDVHNHRFVIPEQVDDVVTAPAFSYLRGIETGNEGLVDQTGIEPVTS